MTDNLIPQCSACGRERTPRADLLWRVYLEHVGLPGDVLDSINRIRECARCAQRYSRDDLLNPVTGDQVYRDGLA